MTKSVHETEIEDLLVSIFRTNEELGQAAAEEASAILRRAVEQKGVANIIVATGNSQLTFLAALRADRRVPWTQVNIFHMDEYVGLDPNHPASFPLFLKRHLLDYIQSKAFFPVPGQARNAEQACQEYESLLRAYPADVCALGIGENGHLAFNDPPFADFDDPVWVKLVKLDEASRRQQVGEGHFGGLDEVPTHAMTLTIPALLAAGRVLAIVPEARKADAVFRSLRGPISEDCPGSILRRTPHAHLFLDVDSARQVYSYPHQEPAVMTPDGAQRRVLSYGGNLMVVQFTFGAGTASWLHSHPHEQVGYVVSGEIDFNMEGRAPVRLTAGGSYYVPPDVKHNIVTYAPTVLVDVFTPIRQDFLTS